MVGSASHHFGEVGQKEEVWHHFVLTNEAGVPVVVTGLTSSCGCTWAADKDEIVGSTLPPDGTLDFPVFLNTGVQQSTAGGKIVLSYRRQTDDPAFSFEGELLLQVEATILPDYRMEPLEIDFGEINGLDLTGTPLRKKTFRIVPDRLKSLEISDVKPSVAVLTSEILSSDSNGHEVEVALDPSSFTESLAFRGNIVVSTNSENVPKGIVTIKAQYITPVDVQPSSIIIPSDKAGTVEEEVLIFTSSPSKILRVDCGESGSIRAEFDPAQKSERHAVKLFVAPCTESDVDAKILVESSLFPSSGKSVSLSKPVSIYRFKQGEKQ